MQRPRWICEFWAAQVDQRCLCVRGENVSTRAKAMACIPRLYDGKQTFRQSEMEAREWRTITKGTGFPGGFWDQSVASYLTYCQSAVLLHFVHPGYTFETDPFLRGRKSRQLILAEFRGGGCKCVIFNTFMCVFMDNIFQHIVINIRWQSKLMTLSNCELKTNNGSPDWIQRLHWDMSCTLSS